MNFGTTKSPPKTMIFKIRKTPPLSACPRKKLRSLKEAFFVKKTKNVYDNMFSKFPVSCSEGCAADAALSQQCALFRGSATVVQWRRRNILFVRRWPTTVLILTGGSFTLIIILYITHHTSYIIDKTSQCKIQYNTIQNITHHASHTSS